MKKMILRLILQLKSPFIDRSSPKQQVVSLFGIGLFVCLFLFVVRPFDIDQIGDRLLLACMGFGGVTILFGWIYDLLNRFVLCINTDVPSWTLWKWIVQSIGLIVWVAFGNYLFMNALFGWHGFHLGFLLQMVYYTVIVGVFPIVFSGLSIQLRAIKSNQEMADQIQTGLHERSFSSATVLQSGLLPEQLRELGQLRYVEAMQNYIHFYYLDGQHLKKETSRNTIMNMEMALRSTSVVRCHRSYLVNVNFIEQLSGNAQGLKLRLRDVPNVEVPVSRSYITPLKALLK
jgi:hypothetical protein